MGISFVKGLQLVCNPQRIIFRRIKHAIPTLEEVMLLAKGKIWVNIDKGYDFFKDVKKVLKKNSDIRTGYY